MVKERVYRGQIQRVNFAQKYCGLLVKASRAKKISLCFYIVINNGFSISMCYTLGKQGAAVAEWLSSWLAEQEDRGSIPGLATWIFRDWLSPASKSRYG